MTGTTKSGGDALFINRIVLRGPEMGLLYRHLAAHGPADRSTLIKRFTPLDVTSSDVVTNALDGLHSLGMIHRSDGTTEPTYSVTQTRSTVPFPDRLLSAFRGAPRRQSVFMDLYGTLIEREQYTLSESELLEFATTHVAIEAGWTQEKVALWLSFADFLGIAIRRSRGMVVAPQSRHLARWIRDATGSSEQLAWDVFQRVNRDLAVCFDRQGNLHVGWTDALDLLRRRGVIELRLGSDSARELRTAREQRWSTIRFVSMPDGWDGNP